MRALLFCLSVLFALPSPAAAEDGTEDGWFSSTVRNVYRDAKKTFQAPERYDVYAPFWIWHNRYAYDYENSRDYNEFPAGGGFGAARTDDNGNEDRLFFMLFMDSNDYLQTALGYSWHKYWRTEPDGWFVGAGIAAAILQRHEYHYLPAPLPLPILSAGYGPVSVETTYIPGVYNNGNILFTWLKVRF